MERERSWSSLLLDKTCYNMYAKIVFAIETVCHCRTFLYQKVKGETN